MKGDASCAFTGHFLTNHPPVLSFAIPRPLTPHHPAITQRRGIQNESNKSSYEFQQRPSLPIRVPSQRGGCPKKKKGDACLSCFAFPTCHMRRATTQMILLQRHFSVEQSTRASRAVVCCLCKSSPETRFSLFFFFGRTVLFFFVHLLHSAAAFHTVLSQCNPGSRPGRRRNTIELIFIPV